MEKVRVQIHCKGYKPERFRLEDCMIGNWNCLSTVSTNCLHRVDYNPSCHHICFDFAISHCYTIAINVVVVRIEDTNILRQKAWVLWAECCDHFHYASGLHSLTSLTPLGLYTPI